MISGQKFVLALIAVAMATVLAVFVATQRAPRGSEPTNSEPERVDARADASATDVPSSEPHAEPLGDAAEVIAQQRELASAETERRVRVLREDGTPADGATVWIERDETTSDDWRAARFAGDDLVRGLTNGLGEPLAVDSNASAVLPPMRRALRIAAVLDDRRAFGVATPGHDLELVLQPDTFVDVVITDSAGEPVAEVEVHLELDVRDGFFEVKSRALTDARGLARLEDAKRDRTRRISLPGVDATPTVAVRPAGDPFARSTAFAVDATGAVEVTLVDIEGRPLDVEMELQLRRAFDADVPEIEPQSALARVVDGRARFPRVALHERWSIYGFDRGFATASQEFDGPTRVGELVRVVRHVRPNTPIVRASLVDENGQRLAFVDTELHFASQFAHIGSDRVARGETDAAGNVEFSARAEFPPRASGVARVVLPRRGQVALIGALVPASVTNDAFGRTIVDCGIARLTPARRLVAGIVVDGQGRPSASARVTPSIQRDPSTPHSSWWPHDIETDSSGSFEFGCDDRPSRLAVIVAAPGWSWTTSRDVRVGEEALRIELVPAAGLRGRILVPDETAAGTVHISLDKTGSRASSPVDVASDGNFARNSTQPGTYSLSVWLRAPNPFAAEDELEPLHRTAPFELRAGEQCDLGDIDLRPKLRTFVIHVLDESGAPIERALVTPNDSDLVSPIEVSTGRSGIARFSSTEETLDVRVSAEGSRAVELSNVTGTTTVTLRPGIAVNVRFPSDFPAIAEPFECHLNLVEDNPEAHGVISCFGPETATQFLGTTQRGHVRAGDVWTLRVPRPGAYVASVWLVDTRTNRTLDVRHVERESLFEVPDSSDTREFTLHAASAEFARALTNPVR